MALQGHRAPGGRPPRPGHGCSCSACSGPTRSTGATTPNRAPPATAPPASARSPGRRPTPPSSARSASNCGHTVTRLPAARARRDRAAASRQQLDTGLSCRQTAPPNVYRTTRRATRSGQRRPMTDPAAGFARRAAAAPARFCRWRTSVQRATRPDRAVRRQPDPADGTARPFQQLHRRRCSASRRQSLSAWLNNRATPSLQLRDRARRAVPDPHRPAARHPVRRPARTRTLRPPRYLDVEETIKERRASPAHPMTDHPDTRSEPQRLDTLPRRDRRDRIQVGPQRRDRRADDLAGRRSRRRPPRRTRAS